MKQLFAIQGDLLFKSINEFPKRLTKKKDNILVHSDSTMHDHTLKSGSVYVNKNGQMFLDVPRATQVVHTADHDPINLPKGKYQMIRQREHLFGDMVRVVVD